MTSSSLIARVPPVTASDSSRQTESGACKRWARDGPSAVTMTTLANVITIAAIVQNRIRPSLR
jgi:hypothetical protein